MKNHLANILTLGLAICLPYSAEAYQEIPLPESAPTSTATCVLPSDGNSQWAVVMIGGEAIDLVPASTVTNSFNKKCSAGLASSRKVADLKRRKKGMTEQGKAPVTPTQTAVLQNYDSSSGSGAAR